MKTVIVDYGLSNLLSVKRAVERCGEAPEVTDDPALVSDADVLILPGVGAFADGMSGLKSKGLIEPLLKKANSGFPLLGICLGMQLLFDESFEFGRHTGLGLINGTIERIAELDTDSRRQTVPHVGWEGLSFPVLSESPAQKVFAEFTKDAEVYFVHTFEAKPEKESNIAAYCSYGGRKICAAAVNDGGNVLGCQFHPEKSGEAGLTIIRGFLRYCRGKHKN